jgi:tRNA(His) 5'-end guanylyltransferase
MIDVTLALVEESNAVLGYTQSDEITLVLMASGDAEPWLGHRVAKLTSVLASLATAVFNQAIPDRIPERAGRMALFDARAWAVPTREEAANVLLWREHDATKNSLSMAARALYAHADLHGRRGAELHDLLHAKGVNWNDYPAFFKRGTYVRREVIERRLTAEELADLPEKHEARRNPDLIVRRSALRAVSMPPFGTVDNRVGVVFEGEAPETVSGG